MQRDDLTVGDDEAKPWDSAARVDPYRAVCADLSYQERDRFWESGRQLASAMQAMLVRRLASPPLRILDVGCGVGRVSEPLAQFGHEVTGIDVSSVMIEQAQRLSSNGHSYVHARLCEHVDQCPEPYDYVFSCLVLQHLPPAEALAEIRFMGDLVRPGGLVVFQFASSRRLPSWATGVPGQLRHLAGSLRRRFQRLDGIRMFSLDVAEARAALSTSGLELLARCNDMSAGPQWESHWFVARR